MPRQTKLPFCCASVVFKFGSLFDASGRGEAEGARPRARGAGARGCFGLPPGHAMSWLRLARMPLPGLAVACLPRPAVPVGRLGAWNYVGTDRPLAPSVERARNFEIYTPPPSLSSSSSNSTGTAS